VQSAECEAGLGIHRTVAESLAQRLLADVRILVRSEEFGDVCEAGGDVLDVRP
jgi:hypothetical protein